MKKSNVIPLKNALLKSTTPRRGRAEKPLGPIVQLVFDAAYDLLDEANGRSVRGGAIAKRVGEPIFIVAPVLDYLERRGLLGGPATRAAKKAAR
jgi:hypothetical protein